MHFKRSPSTCEGEKCTMAFFSKTSFELKAYLHAPHSKVPFKEHFSLFLTTSLFWH